jgi:hypothetical protein
MRIVVTTDESGEPRLSVVDGSFEQIYRLQDHHSTTLFLALSRSKGHLPYRRARQHDSTVCVRATLAEHDALWSSFLELNKHLATQLAAATLAFVRAHVEPKPR